MIDSSRTPVIASCSVRGIGVADSVSTCTSDAQLLQALLVRDAEMLLLVDDDEAEILEDDRLAEQRVGADDDVDRALGEALLRFALLGGADHARKLADPDRQPGEALDEILGVLAREQGRGNDDRGLLAVDRGGEGGAQGDLGLAEADVAADQPVHRPARREVVERRLDGGGLVLRFVIREARAEFVVEPFGRDQARRRARHALRGDANQFARHLAHAFLQPRLTRLPAGRPQAIELALLGAVARQQFEILDRQEQPIAAGVVYLQAVVRRARRLDRRQADEAADAVIDVDDEVAGGERGGFREHVLGAALALLLAHQAIAENVLLADDGEIVRLEAVLQRDDRERQRAGARASWLARRRRPAPAISARVRRARGSGARASRRSSRRRRREGPLSRKAPDVSDRRVEDVDVFVEALGGEIASDPAAAIDDVRRARRSLERRQPRQRRASSAAGEIRPRSDRADPASAAGSRHLTGSSS